MDSNKIYNYDFNFASTYILDNSIDLILTDHPYGCNATMKGEYNDDEEFIKTQIPIWIENFYRILKDNSYCFIYVPSLYIENWIIESKKKFKLLNILSVENMKVGINYEDRFRNNCQLILVLTKGKPKGFNKVDWIKTSKSWFNDKRNKEPSLYNYSYPSYIPNYYKATVEENNGHPDEKNVEFIEKLILISTNENDVVFDGFVGSGSVCVASINVNRKFLGFEINENYYKISNIRINKLLKQNKLPF